MDIYDEYRELPPMIECEEKPLRDDEIYPDLTTLQLSDYSEQEIADAIEIYIADLQARYNINKQWHIDNNPRAYDYVDEMDWIEAAVNTIWALSYSVVPLSGQMRLQIAYTVADMAIDVSGRDYSRLMDYGFVF